MILKKASCLLLFTLLFGESYAQKIIHVVDMSTNRPLQNVEVTIKTTLPTDSLLEYHPNDTVKRTNYKGVVVMPRDYTLAIFYYSGYETLRLNFEEVSDTISLLPKFNLLNEVVVYGQQQDINSNFKLNKTEAQLLQPHPQGFNILGLPIYLLTKIFPKRHKVNKDKVILDNY